MERRITDEKLEHAKRIITEVARQHGVPEAKVREEILSAMRIGMANPDPDVRKQWSAIPWRGPEPTVEEFIAWTALMVEETRETKQAEN